MTPEGRVREYLKARAKALGFEHRKLRWIGRRAAPDEFLFWPSGVTIELNGQRVHLPLPILVEVKRKGETPEPHQQREIDRLRHAGFVVCVVDSVESVDALFADLVAVTNRI